MEEEDYATLQAYIRTLKQEVASMHYSSAFEVAALCDYPPKEERWILLPKIIMNSPKFIILKLVYSLVLVLIRFCTKPCTYLCKCI